MTCVMDSLPQRWEFWGASYKGVQWEVWSEFLKGMGKTKSYEAKMLLSLGDYSNTIVMVGHS